METIALLLGVSGLSLDDPSLRFQGDTPPPGPVLEEAQQIGTEGIDFVFSTTADPEGNVYLGGGTTGSLGGPKIGPRDAWLAKYDSKGNQMWSKQFSTTAIETVWAVADDGNTIYVVGDTTDALTSLTTGLTQAVAEPAKALTY